MKKFTGIYPALLTPFDHAGNLNAVALEKVIEHNINKGVRGFYVGGSTGEFLLLSMEERKELLVLVTAIVSKRVDIIVNIGAFATEHTIDLARHAESLDVAAISAVPPFYFKFNLSEYLNFYADIAKAVSLPMVIYNIPVLTGVHLDQKALEQLFAIEHVVGMKHTSYDLHQMQRIIEKFPDTSVFGGHDELFLPAYSLGARAAIGSTFNFMAEKFITLEKLFIAGEMEKALILQGEINKIVEVLTEIGVFKGVKAALRFQGIDCGECRKPFMPLSLAEEEKWHKTLEKYC
ncbi:MAG: N-acetylneuraminate lyase [Lachnospiraceae bacterium]|nr:N-acetylneuraminate lyase [Lachnospiraceae bacterium]